MFLKKVTILFVLSVLIIVLQSCKLNSGSAPVILAASTALSDVQAAVDSAESGGVVSIPRGSSTWDAALQIPDNKKIMLCGSGEDATIISSDTAGPGSLINIGASGSRISNIGFRIACEDGNGIVVRGEDWRVDYCRFDNVSSDYGNAGVYARGLSTDDGSPVGLVDHCEFNDMRVLVCGDASLMANSIWAEPLGLG
ncbi:MAG: hypothetical protein P8Y62_09210, partial [candidate division WOR-3 bacterium]